MKDLDITCVGPYEGTPCPNNSVFLFTVSEQEFFKERNFQTPKRCTLCRDLKKSRFNEIANKSEHKRNRNEGMSDAEMFGN